jgi:hypothetical protein
MLNNQRVTLLINAYHYQHHHFYRQIIYIYIITVPLSWSLGNFWDMPNQFGIIVNPLQGPMMLANPAK